jgi:hypothetical protein
MRFQYTTIPLGGQEAHLRTFCARAHQTTAFCEREHCFSASLVGGVDPSARAGTLARCNSWDSCGNQDSCNSRVRPASTCACQRTLPLLASVCCNQGDRHSSIINHCSCHALLTNYESAISTQQAWFGNDI